jgi:hypothetical protein
VNPGLQRIEVPVEPAMVRSPVAAHVLEGESI